MATIYSVTALSSGTGRDGHVSTDDGAIDFEMRTPKALGGSGDGFNPEQLFAAGYAACFHSALQSIARKHKIKIDASTVSALVELINPAPETYGLAVKLTVSLPSLTPELAAQFTEEAHLICPYSNATRGNIEVVLELTATSAADLSPVA